MRPYKFLLATTLVGTLLQAALAQSSSGTSGPAGLQARSIAGSGGLRRISIPGSIPGGATFGTFGLSPTYGTFRTQGGGGGAIKPFSNLNARPTVSPYLNLFRNDLSGQSDFNYQTLVRPQLQQQQVNSQLQTQDLQAARRLQSIAAQADFNPSGANDQYPTGHQSTYNYTGHYFPPVQRPLKPGRQ